MNKETREFIFYLILFIYGLSGILLYLSILSFIGSALIAIGSYCILLDNIKK